MPKKLTIEEIQNFIKEKDINNDCVLLSTKYVNSTTPLLLQCNRCGQTFERDWAHLKRGRFMCTSCATKNTVRSKITIQEVKDFIIQNDVNKDCTLLSEVYINSTTPLRLRCNLCGQEFERDYAHIKRGRFRCAQCGIEAGARKLEYTIEDVDRALAEKGYIRKSNYTNASTPFIATCKRGHEVTLHFSHFLAGHSGCKHCADLDKTGPLSPNWLGGESEVIDKLRKSLINWKKAVLARDGYKCAITGKRNDLVIHHLTSFNTLVDLASKETGIPVLRKISDYQNLEDYNTLQIRVIELHHVNDGITLTKEIHDEFHRKFGKGNNNWEQFEEFTTFL